VIRPRRMILSPGNDPYQSKAATAGVAMSNNPWGVRERAKKSFKCFRTDCGMGAVTALTKKSSLAEMMC
jgi:hypothetical protein